MDLINTYTPIDNDEINTLNEQIEQLYNQYLKSNGLSLPRKNSAKRYWLVYLYKYIGKAVHKDIISQFVRDYIPNAGQDQQVRHLGAQDHFYCLNWKEEYKGELVPRGYSLLVNLIEPHPNFFKEQHKREVFLTTKNFDDLKKSFNYCCASCGAKEGQVHRITGKIVHLQKGHINPSLPLTIENTIPQCEYCNQNIYKNNFIFDNNGYPKKIYNPNYILNCDENIQKEIYTMLAKKFKEENLL